MMRHEISIKMLTDDLFFYFFMYGDVLNFKLKITFWNCAEDFRL